MRCFPWIEQGSYKGPKVHALTCGSNSPLQRHGLKAPSSRASSSRERFIAKWLESLLVDEAALRSGGADTAGLSGEPVPEELHWAVGERITCTALLQPSHSCLEVAAGHDSMCKMMCFDQIQECNSHLCFETLRSSVRISAAILLSPQSTLSDGMAEWTHRQKACPMVPGLLAFAFKGLHTETLHSYLTATLMQ